MSNSQLQCPRELLLLVVRKFLANTNMAIELERRNLYAEEGPRPAVRRLVNAREEVKEVG